MGTLLRYPYIAALRPRQWTKNLVVFAAPLFAFDIRLETFLGACLALVLFCSVSSCFYLINDVLDVEADRKHPVKSKRPIASGLVPVKVAIAMAITLLVGAVTLGTLRTPLLGLVLIGYALLQVAYNLRLKRTVILDIVAIAMGFVLRALAGAVATGIVLSPWFLLCTAMLALFLGVEKRKAELRISETKGGKTRAVLQRYSPALLNRMENSVTSGAIITYSIWSAGPKVGGATTPWMMMTIPFVLYGIFRYQLLSDPHEIARKSGGTEEGGQTERPEEVLLRDLPILLTVVCWTLTAFVILLLKQKGLIE
ncbi:MAG: decaprenyl-phosphate phosphoribosyltransferase [Leptolyngbyaceae cyanobacterium bins.59]|nr:decaprenyl-phosphate phosphoribosyltransferase [Leptolyngbyaceae cyanobacterium bins.59]